MNKSLASLASRIRGDIAELEVVLARMQEAWLRARLLESLE